MVDLGRPQRLANSWLPSILSLARKQDSTCKPLAKAVTKCRSSLKSACAGGNSGVFMKIKGHKFCFAEWVFVLQNLSGMIARTLMESKR